MNSLETVMPAFSTAVTKQVMRDAQESYFFLGFRVYGLSSSTFGVTTIVVKSLYKWEPF